MDKKTYDRLKKRTSIALRKYANDLRTEEIDECVHDILCTWLHRRANGGNKKGQTVDQAVIEYLRRQRGRTGEANKDFKEKMFFAMELKEHFRTEVKAQAFPPVNSVADILEIADLFSGGTRAIIILRYIWGLSLYEVGHVFGVSESRIQQLLKVVPDKTMKALALKKQDRRAKQIFRQLEKYRKDFKKKAVVEPKRYETKISDVAKNVLGLAVDEADDIHGIKQENKINGT